MIVTLKEKNNSALETVYIPRNEHALPYSEDKQYSPARNLSRNNEVWFRHNSVSVYWESTKPNS